MSQRWESETPPTTPKVTAMGYVRFALRTVCLFPLVFGGLVILLLVRLVERPLCGVNRPVTPHVTQFVCRNALRLIGLRLNVTGAPMQGAGAVVANHTSWLDIFVLNASKRIYFVSKSEVANWPGIGWLARATGTVFIERNRSQARQHTRVFEDRLQAGHKLLFFPEGTSTDGQQVLQFKTTLFQSFFTQNLRDIIAVQPVSVVYRAPPGEEKRFYGWWGGTDFGPHLLFTLASAKRGTVDVTYHAPLPVAAFANRKALSRACEEAVRAGHSAALARNG